MRSKAMHFWAVLSADRGVMMYRRGVWYRLGTLGAQGDSAGWPEKPGKALFPFMLPSTAHRISLKRLGETEGPQAGAGGSSYAVEAIVHRGHGDGLLFGPLHLKDHRNGGPSMAERVKAAEDRGLSEVEPNHNMISVCSANSDVWSLMWPEYRNSAKNYMVFRLGVKVFDALFPASDMPVADASRWGGVGEFMPEMIKQYAAGMATNSQQSHFARAIRRGFQSTAQLTKHRELIQTMAVSHRRRLTV